MAERRIAKTPKLALVLFIGLSAAAAGCSSSRDDLDRKLAKMQQQLTAVQASHDALEERLEAVELSAVVTARAVEREQSPRQERLERPPLKVIRVEPDGSSSVSSRPAEDPAVPDSTAPDSDEPRPVIRGQGDRVIKTGDDGAADDGTADDGSAAHRGIELRRGSAVALAKPGAAL